MYFSQYKHLREIEKIMQSIPNFRPRGYGVIALQEMDIPPPTFAEAMLQTTAAVKCPAFRKRLHQYLDESEGNPAMYQSGKHKAAFEAAARKENQDDYALMAALFLLTADSRTWGAAKWHITNGHIFFEKIHMQNCTETAYALLCAAKDLYLGTRHMTISDLADKDVISPKVFADICTAMAIRRFGLGIMGDL